MASRVIQISFSDTEYTHLQAKAKAEGMTIALYIKNKVLEDTEFNKWFRELLERVSRIRPGTTFNIKAVMSTDWVNIDRGVRLAMGRAFYNYVVASKVEGVRPTHKDSANVQWYVTGGGQ
jgi:hypothetical protein